jgi:hypothetical protein
MESTTTTNGRNTPFHSLNEKNSIKTTWFEKRSETKTQKIITEVKIKIIDRRKKC